MIVEGIVMIRKSFLQPGGSDPDELLYIPTNIVGDLSFFGDLSFLLNIVDPMAFLPCSGNYNFWPI